jgi:shikimate dehydrogenase
MTASKSPAACLIGWPAAHSRSPLIHHYWLRTLGIEGGYVIEAVPPEDLRDFVLRLSLRGFVGANVTIPHKESVLALSTPDARARAVGAANTLWFADGELRSTNTDVEGFIGNLDASAPGWDAAEEALVLGAGGSSRAVVFGLLERGFKRVHLANRTIARAETLARQFGPKVQPLPWDAIGDVLPRAKLLVNTTSLHARPALARCRRRAPATGGGRCRPRLRPADDAAACRGQGAWPEDRRRARHAAASGGARLRAVVRPAARGHGRTARIDRGRSHKDLRE